MQITYTLTADDFHHAQIAYRNRNFFSRWTNLFLALLLVLWAAVQVYLHFAGLSQPWLRWSFPLTLFGIWILGFAGGVGLLLGKSWSRVALELFCWALIMLVLMASYSAIGLGTLSGGWRIVHTMGARLTRLKPRRGNRCEL